MLPIKTATDTMEPIVVFEQSYTSRSFIVSIPFIIHRSLQTYKSNIYLYLKDLTYHDTGVFSTFLM